MDPLDSLIRNTYNRVSKAENKLLPLYEILFSDNAANSQMRSKSWLRFARIYRDYRKLLFAMEVLTIQICLEILLLGLPRVKPRSSLSM
jgi:hypothetical protein